MGFSSFCFLILVALASWQANRRVWLMVAMTLAFGLTICAWWFVDQLSGNGIDYAVIYHLRMGLQGAGISDLRGKIAGLLAWWFLVVLLSTIPLLIRRYRVGKPVVWQKAAFAGVYMLAWAFSPPVQDALRLHKQTQSVATDGVSGQYKIPRDGVGRGKKNVVVLYLESLERSYLDESVFPGLMPGIRQLSDEGIDFTNVSSMEGSGWTIGGIVSSLCGLPLVLNEESNEFGSVGRFMPGAVCLSDYLGEQGYNLEFVGGAAGEFAGKGPFLAQHGFGTVLDRQHFVERQVPPERFSAWGVQDDVMLDAMAERFQTLSREGKPFLLAGLTLGTHPPDGSIAQECQDVHYNAAGNGEQMLRAVACTDRLVQRFVERLRASPGWRDTLLVIASDHLSMPNEIRPMLGSVDKRSNLLLLLGDGIHSRKVNRPGATVDTAAIIADAMGLAPSVGFGRSLMRDLAEPGMSATVQGGGSVVPYLQYAKSTWMLGSLSDGLRIEKDRLELDGQSFQLPLAMITDVRGGILSLGLLGVRSRLPAVDFAGGQQLLFIDRCAAFGRVDTAAEWCLWRKAGTEEPRMFGHSQLESKLSLAQLSKEGTPAPAREDFLASFIVTTRFAPEYSAVGEFRDGRVYSNGREGALVYGPFVDLCPGTYRLSIKGSAKPATSAWTDFAADARSAGFLRDELSETTENAGLLNDREVFLPSPLSRTEVRVFVRAGDAVRLDGYTLLPAYPQLMAGQRQGFGQGQGGERLLGCGWGSEQQQARLSTSQHARLRFALDPQWASDAWRLDFSLAGVNVPADSTLQLRVNQSVVGSWALDGKRTRYRATVPAGVVLDPGTVDTVFELLVPPDAANEGAAKIELYDVAVRSKVGKATSTSRTQ